MQGRLHTKVTLWSPGSIAPKGSCELYYDPARKHANLLATVSITSKKCVWNLSRMLFRSTLRTIFTSKRWLTWCCALNGTATPAEWRATPGAFWSYSLRERFEPTFFVVGWVAERFPALVREIAAAGHELAR